MYTVSSPRLTTGVYCIFIHIFAFLFYMPPPQILTFLHKKMHNGALFSTCQNNIATFLLNPLKTRLPFRAYSCNPHYTQSRNVCVFLTFSAKKRKNCGKKITTILIFCYYVFLVILPLHLGQVISILPLPFGTRRTVLQSLHL